MILICARRGHGFPACHGVIFDSDAGMRTTVLMALSSPAASDDITICGWVRTRRDAKAFSFLEINDGSCLRGIQAVVDAGIPGAEQLAQMTTGASVKVRGKWSLR